MNRLTGPLLAALIVLGIMAPARAQEVSSGFRFEGGGWGHGLGMSQYGAKGFADHGDGYDKILNHYYTDTSLAKLAAPSDGDNAGVIRVGLLQGRSDIRVTTASGSMQLTHPGLPGGSQQIASGEVWRVGASSGKFVVYRPDGSSVATLAGDSPLYLDFESSGAILRLPDTGYRYKYGRGEINVQGNALRAVLTLPFESYLYGLGEMPSSWATEALKAQAVAGRTYALEKAGRLGQHRSDCNCAVYATTIDQAYIGYDKEDAASGSRWRAAVDATAGEVSTYGGKPIQALYHSTSGGHTENNENVWGGSSIPYLRGVDDPYESSPFSSWKVTLTDADITSRLSSRTETAVGFVSAIDVVPPRGVSGRVNRVISTSEGGLRITGKSKTARSSGDTLRSLLGLRSTLYYVTRISLHPMGSAVQVKGQPEVWWLDGQGRRLHVSSPNEMTALGLRSTEVVPVTNEELTTFAEPTLPYPEGSLLSGPGGTNYLVSGGTKRAFPSDDVLTSLGYSTDSAVGVSAPELAQIPTGAPLSAGSKHPDGTIVQGSGDRVYLLQGGAKSPINSAAVYESRFRWNQIVKVQEQEMLTYPDGPPVRFRDGSLIAGPSDTVYVVTTGARRAFPSADSFDRLGFRWDAIRRVSEQDVSLQPDAGAVSGRPDGGAVQVSGKPEIWWLDGQGRRLQLSSVNELTALGLRSSDIVPVTSGELSGFAPPTLPYPNGSLLIAPNGTTYVVSNGTKRPFPSLETFNALGYSFKPALKVRSDELAQLPTGAELAAGSKHPDGTLVQGGGDRVYLLDAGAKSPISSAPLFESRFRWNQIVKVSDTELATYTDGPSTRFRDGSLISGPSDTVYAVAAGARRSFSSADVFTGLGYRWDAVRKVAQSDVDLHPAGEPMG